MSNHDRQGCLRLSRARCAVAACVSAVMLVGGGAAHAIGRQAMDMLAPGSGPLAVWDFEPACLGGDSSAPISICKADLPVDAHLERALVHVWFRDFEGARNEAMSLPPGDLPAGEAELFLARLLLTEVETTGDRSLLRSAHVYATQSLTRAGRRADKIATLGAIEEAASDRVGALKRFDEAIAIDRGHVFALHRRVQLLAAMTLTSEALADADRLVELEPEQVRWYELRGKLRSNFGDFGGAVSDYTRVLELARPEVAVMIGRSRANAALGKLSEAIGDLTALIDGDMVPLLGGEELADLLQERGALLLGLGNGPDAARDYLGSLEVGGARAAVNLQLTLRRLGWEIEADGHVSERLRRGISECLVSRRCQPAVLQRV